MEEQINKTWFIHTTEHRSAVEGNEVWAQATTGVDLGNVK